jgi:transcriptional regulator with XRE-family HTH domain
MQIDVKELRRAMAAKGFTIASLARVAGITTVTLNNLLKHNSRARTDTLGKLSRALGVDIYDIVREEA